MTGKAKPKKHTAKEMAATTNRGGGLAGMVDCKGLDKGEFRVYDVLHRFIASIFSELRFFSDAMEICRFYLVLE